jgi:hypothetical protein
MWNPPSPRRCTASSKPSRGPCSPQQPLPPGLAKLNWYPGGEQFLDRLFLRMGPLLHTFSGQELQFLITSCVGLSYVPPEPFVVAFRRAVAAVLPSLAPRDLSLILWTFAALDVPRSRSFLVALMGLAVRRSSRSLGRSMGHHELPTCQEGSVTY